MFKMEMMTLYKQCVRKVTGKKADEILAGSVAFSKKL